MNVLSGQPVWISIFVSGLGFRVHGIEKFTFFGA